MKGAKQPKALLQVARNPSGHHSRLPNELLNFARKMRGDCTNAEALLWSVLRDRRLGGFKFRRQHPVGGCVLDFYCHEARLAIELDGGQHDLDQHAAKDAQRTARLEGAGVRVLRFWDSDVFRNTRGVLLEIWDALQSRAPSPSPLSESSPSPPGRGRG